MRFAIMAAIAALAAGAATMAGATPAAAYEYPYCASDCSYETFAQCQAAASGRNISCTVNPRASLNEQPRPERRYRNH